MIMKPFKIKGSRRDLGFAHGEEYRDKIHRLIDKRKSILFSEVANLSEETLSNVCRASIQYIHKAAPKIYEEIEAVACACGIDISLLIIAGGYTDLLDIFNACNKHEYSECSILANPQAGYICGTWDSHAGAQESMVLLHRCPSDANTEVLALTTAGWPAQQGINSNGLAFAINNLVPNTASPYGLNYIAANAVMAEATTLDCFSEYCSKVNFSSGHAYILLNNNGRGLSIETAVNKVSQHRFCDTFIHTNHYLHSPLIDDNKACKYFESSILRMNELISSKENISNSKSFSEFLSESIYVNKSNRSESAKTCAHYFLLPKQQKMYFLPGAGEGSPMREITLA